MVETLIIPGAPKAGTTSLFEVISKHPGVAGARLKEPHLFSLDEQTIQENLDWYDGLFAGSAKNTSFRLEASTSYLYSDRAPANIARYLGDPKLLVILRDPARRAFSAFKHMARKAPSRDRRQFSEILSQLEDKAPTALREREHATIRAVEERGEIVSEYCGRNYMREYWQAPFDSHFEDPQWPYRYFTCSCYSEYVPAFEKLFGDRLKVVFLEELQESPEVVLDEIFAFLELDRRGLELEAKNPSLMPRNRLARYASEIRHSVRWGGRLIGMLKTMGLGEIVALLRQAVYENPSLSLEEYSRARELLQPEYEYWGTRSETARRYWVWKAS